MAFDYTNYTPVEYIESSGTQYIQSPIPAGNGVLEIDISINGLNTSATQQIYFGCRIGSGNIADYIHTSRSSLGGGIKSSWKDSLFGYAANTRYLVRTEMIKQPGETTNTFKFFVNGSLCTSSGNFSDFINNSYKFDILAYYNPSLGSPHVIPAIGAKLYGLKWYDANENFLYNFVPCITKDPTPVAGLYETINEVFYGNDGTGTFAYGIPIVTGSNVWLKDSGTWKQADTVYIKDAGVWKAATNVYIKDSNSWKS